MPRRVVLERSVRNAAPGAALLKENHAISLRIEETAVVRDQSGSWSTVQKDDGLSIRSAALLVVKLMLRRHSDVSTVVRLEFGVQGSSCFHVAGIIARHCC